MALPRAGEYPAEEILALAGKLHGRVVRLESERVRETKVEVSKELGGTQVSEEELTVLLAAHQLYLFPITDPKEGKILVVSRNPQWKEEPPRFTKIIQAPSKGFGETWAGIERAVNERNANLPKGIEPVVAVPSARTGKIFLRAGRTEDLDAIEKAAEAFLEKKGEKDSNRPRLYTYQGHYRAAKALEAEVLEKLDEGERDRLRFVISSKGNRLLYRCPALLAEKVEKLLKELDKPEQKKSEEHQKKS